jgi:Phage derived protein Gp49-like (DUF891)
MSDNPPSSPRRDNFLLEGQKLQIVFAIRANGSMPAKEFFDNELNDAERRRFRPPMERLAETRNVTNREHFKKVEGSEELWEFKSHQLRILGFYMPDGRFALAYGLRKKQDRLRPADIQVADQIRKEFTEYEAKNKQRGGGEVRRH